MATDTPASKTLALTVGRSHLHTILGTQKANELSSSFCSFDPEVSPGIAVQL